MSTIIIVNSQIKEKKFKYGEKIAALLSYFARELSVDNIISDEVLVYACPSLDMCTRNVAVIAALWLEHLICREKDHEENEIFWSSFKNWLEARDPMMYNSFIGSEERGEHGKFFRSKLFTSTLELYVKQCAIADNNQIKSELDSNSLSIPKEPDEIANDPVLEELLMELRRVQEYQDGSEMASDIKNFKNVKIAAWKYITSKDIKFPPIDSYINVLPFHWDTEEIKFRNQVERKRSHKI